MQRLRFLYVIIIPLVLLSACKGSEQSARGSAPSKGRTSAGGSVALMNNFMNGNKEKILGNYELAINYFNKCLKLDPEHSASLFELANIYEFQGKDVMALSHVRRAVDIDGENVWYARLLGLVYEKHGMFDEAAQVYEGIVTSHPTDIDAYYDLANAYNTARKLEKAVNVFDRLEKEMGRNEETLTQKHRLYLRMGEPGKAIEVLEQLIELNPQEAQYYGMMAELYQKQGEDEKALESYQKVQEIDPDNPYVQLSLNDYYKAAGDQEKAFDALKKAFGNTKLDIDTKVQRLLAYYTRTETDPTEKPQAMELCELLTKTHPDNAKAYSIYGDFLNRDKKHKEARKAFKKAVLLAPDKFVIWNQLLVLESELRDWKAMQEESSEAMEVFPSQPAFYLYNGIAAIQLKEYDKAIESLTSGKSLIIDNRPLKAQFMANLGEAYNGTEEHESSDKAYEEAVALEPGNAGTLNNYAYYLSLRGDKLERAAELSQQSNDLAPNQPSYLDTYGWILYKMGRYEEAKTYQNKAIEAGGKTNDVILEHYGDILFKLGDTSKALDYWKQARSFGPGSDLLEQKIEQQELLE